MYEFETHLHTNACSACGASTAFEMVDAAANAGYSGLALANHFYHGNTAIDRNLSWSEFVKPYVDEYNEAFEYGKKKGICVIFGIEEVYAPGKEMLIYGVPPKKVAEADFLRNATAKELSDFVHLNGGIAICAHPFRDRDYIPNPDEEPDLTLFDGIEVYNRGNHPEENKKAEELAKRTGVRGISGGDVHHKDWFGKSGIVFNHPIETSEEFVRAILNNEYKMIIETI